VYCIYHLPLLLLLLLVVFHLSYVLLTTFEVYSRVKLVLNVIVGARCICVDEMFKKVSLVGIKTTNRMQQLLDFNTVCYEKVIQQVCNGHQVGCLST